MLHTTYPAKGSVGVGRGELAPRDALRRLFPFVFPRENPTLPVFLSLCFTLPLPVMLFITIFSCLQVG